MNFQKSRISKFIDYAILFLASLVTLPSLYLLFLGLNLPVPYIQLSNLHQVIIFSALLLLFLVLYKIHLYPGWELSKGKLFLRDFLLAIFILTYPFVLFYSNPNLSISGTFQVIKPYIQPAYYALLGITALAVLFAPKDDLIRVNRWFVGEIDARHLQDEEAETRRVLGFNKKYPKFAEIKFVGEFCAGIWAVGSGYLLCLLLLATAGLVLRMWNSGYPGAVYR